MIKQRPWLTLWRLVLEAQAPLSIGTGRGDGVNDMVLAHDANGLPMLPASACAGALRKAWAAAHVDGRQRADDVFGYAEGDDGLVSRLAFSHGHIHDSTNRPVEGLDSRGRADPLLKPLLERRPSLRQRVRLNHRGAADDGALFDRSVLPAGHRFSLELLLWSADGTQARADTDRLEALLANDTLRLGGATRSGLGLLRVVRGHRGQFNLRFSEDFESFSGLGRSLADVGGLSSFEITASAAAPDRQAAINVRLRPEAGFRFGGGTRSLQRPAPGKLANDLPVTEAHVAWAGTKAGAGGAMASQARALVPATGIKGPLSHRTAFHAHRREQVHSGNWPPAAPAGAPPPPYDKTLHCPSVRALFGWHAAGSADSERGQAGVLGWSDLVLAPESIRAATQWHNSIDRYTGGVREGALFRTENLHAARAADDLLVFRITVDLNRARNVGVSDLMLQDLEAALEDLTKGRLALGADSAGGQGFFTGSWQWEGRRPELAPDPTPETQEQTA